MQLELQSTKPLTLAIVAAVVVPVLVKHYVFAWQVAPLAQPDARASLKDKEIYKESEHTGLAGLFKQTRQYEAATLFIREETARYGESSRARVTSCVGHRRSELTTLP